MTAIATRLAVAAVRAWTRLYTWRLDPVIRDARRAEIDSDLWESQVAEDAGSALPIQLTLRLLRGVVNDLRWRVEIMTVHSHVAWRKILLALGSAAIAGCGWLALFIGPTELPQLPAAPPLVKRANYYPPPPPPPPPPCAPPGLGRQRASHCPS
jgi:hypothetical protein